MNGFPPFFLTTDDDYDTMLRAIAKYQSELDMIERSLVKDLADLALAMRSAEDLYEFVHIAQTEDEEEETAEISQRLTEDEERQERLRKWAEDEPTLSYEISVLSEALSLINAEDLTYHRFAEFLEEIPTLKQDAMTAVLYYLAGAIVGNTNLSTYSARKFLHKAIDSLTDDSIRFVMVCQDP